MARPAFDEEKRKKEGFLLNLNFSLAKARDKHLTRAALLRELGLTGSVYSQWVSGCTRIPDQHLLYLGRRLGFNPIEIRPELEAYGGLPVFYADVELHEKMLAMTFEQRQMVHSIVDLMIEAFRIGKAS